MSVLVNCNILNTELLATTVDDAVVLLREGIKENKAAGQYICNTSVSDVMNARNDNEYITALNNSWFTLPNSSQLVVEMHTQGYPLAKKISVFNFMKLVLANCDKNVTHYFVCSDEELVNEIELSVKELFPDVKLAGASYAYSENVIDEINAENPDVIWVGIGGKDEAVWLQNNAHKFNGISVGIGYALNSFVKGKVWDSTRRFGMGYVMMNIKYLILTGKKFLWTTLSWLPAFAMVMVIFILTLQTGEVSKTTSGRVAESVAVKASFLGMDLSRYITTAEQLEDFNSLIRFLAHIGEYAALALCLGFAITANGIRKKIRFLYVCMLGIFVAIVDEFIQIFVPNRYGDLYDLMCDSLGVIVIAFLIHAIGRKKKPKLEVPVSSEPRRRKFLNIHIDDISFDDAVDRIIDMSRTENKQFVITPNVDHVIKNEKDIVFRKIYERADLILTDGTPLMWIADSLGYPIKEKIPGSDMLPRVCEKAAKEGRTLFFLGAAEGVADEAARRLTEKYPGLKVIGTYSPPVGFEKNKLELEKAINAVNEKNADILVLSLGSPKQEKFMYNYLERLNFHVALPFGAAIDFEAGNVKRAPLWMRKCGLEWFYRFLLEPGRLFRRYFIDDIKIFWIAWKYRNEIIRLK